MIQSNTLKKIGKPLIILGAVIFGCHHCSRLTMPGLYDAAYPICENAKTETVLKDEKLKSMTIRDDCWGGNINIGGDNYKLEIQAEPDAFPVTAICEGTIIRYEYPKHNSFLCGSKLFLKSDKAKELKILFYRQPYKRRWGSDSNGEKSNDLCLTA